MLNDEEATRAIRELNGAVLNGNRLNVEVCKIYSYEIYCWKCSKKDFMLVC